MTITSEELRRLLDYDPTTGLFKWKDDVIGGAGAVRIKAGTVAGSRRIDGYIAIKINQQLYLGHRLAWLYTHGVWPSKFIDHINLDRADNRMANLREATPAENLRNATARSSNKLGLKGVRWHKKDKKYQARIQINGRQIHLGSFKDPNEAHDAYKEASKKYHGAFARAE